MVLVEHWMLRRIEVGILGTIDFVCLVMTYRFLKLIRIPVGWATVSIGLLIGGASVWLCGAALAEVTGADRGSSNLIGALSFLIAVFALSQWTTRQWYLVVKWAAIRPVAKATRGMLLYLRDHHMFFGWLVLLTATAHAVILIPFWSHLSQYEVVTGFVALAVLALLTALGQWIELRVRRKQLAPNARWLHTVLAFAFLAAFALHA